MLNLTLVTRLSNISFNRTSNTVAPCFNGISIPRVIGYAVLLLVSLAGNSLVVTVIVKNKLAKKNVHLLLLNMAVADLLVSVVYLSRMIVMMIYGDIWIITGEPGLILCRIVPFLHHLTILVSVLTILCATVDRFLAIVFPLRNILSLSVVKVIVVTTWLLSAILQSPYIFTAVLVPVAGGFFTCNVRFPILFGKAGTQVYHEFRLWWYCSSLVIIVILYTITIVKLKRSKHIGASSDIALARKQKASKKLLKLFLAVTACFICCWSLYFFADIFIDRPFPCNIYFIRFFLAHSNSALNPCVLILMDCQYRKGFKVMFNRSPRAQPLGIELTTRNQKEEERASYSNEVMSMSATT